MRSLDTAIPRGRLPQVLARAGAPRADRCHSCSVRRFAICAALPLEELGHLIASGGVKTLRPHEILFLEGDVAAHLFVVKSGVIKLYKQLNDGRQQVTGFVFGGDLIGLSIRECHMVTAEAVTGTSVCAVPRGRMRELVTAFPELEEQLLALVSHELSAAQDQLLLLGRRTAVERLACFLLLLSHRAVERGQPASPVHLPMNRSDIADYLGLTIETVSRSFTRLVREGAIRLVDPHRVEVVRRDTLGVMSEGGVN